MEEWYQYRTSTHTVLPEFQYTIKGLVWEGEQGGISKDETIFHHFSYLIFTCGEDVRLSDQNSCPPVNSRETFRE